MNKLRYFLITILAAALPAGSALAAQQPTSTTFTLTGPTSLTPSLAGVVTSPYYGNTGIAGAAALNAPSTPVICDDFAADSYVPEQWTAYVTSLSDLAAGVYGAPDPYVRWTGATSSSFTVNGTVYQGWNLNQAQAYDAAALVAIDILNSTGLAQQEYSFAMWGLFDPAAFTQLGGTSKAYESAALADLEAVISNVVNGTGPTGGSLAAYLNNYNVTIYSYVPPSAGGIALRCGSSLNVACASGPPQEFVAVSAISMPEAPTPLVLAIDLLGVMGLVFFLRRKLFAN